MSEKKGIAIGGPADGRELSSAMRYIEVPENNPDFDPVQHGWGLNEYGLTVDGQGNRPWRRVLYEWDGTTWRPQP